MDAVTAVILTAAGAAMAKLFETIASYIKTRLESNAEVGKIKDLSRQTQIDKDNHDYRAKLVRDNEELKSMWKQCNEQHKIDTKNCIDSIGSLSTSLATERSERARLESKYDKIVKWIQERHPESTEFLDLSSTDEFVITQP